MNYQKVSVEGKSQVTPTAAAPDFRAPLSLTPTIPQARAGSMDAAFAKKCVLITGMTEGFLARLVLEKILRTLTHIKTVFIHLPLG
jgi:hypothetical protein